MNFNKSAFQFSATDLSNHLGCGHLTQLNRSAALGEIKKPDWNDPSLAVLAERGEQHEALYVKYLQEKGLTSIYLKNKPVEATIDAMKNGIDVIVQARLERDVWMGYADILLKIPGSSKFGNWSYEVQDTKLASDTRSSVILQLCLYTDLLANLQGFIPWKMHVVKPGSEFDIEEFLFTDFQAYYRSVKANFQATLDGAPPVTYPDPVQQCEICRWWKNCDSRRHNDDHLSLIASIRTLQIEELKFQGINSLAQYAKESKALQRRPTRGRIESYESIFKQAQIQLKGRVEKKLVHELLKPEVGRGLTRLPAPTKYDIYFDIEGDPFYDGGGLEYLLGFSFTDETNRVVYKSHWATDRVKEKKIFEEFIDFVMSWWKKHPTFYIYHYGIYEPSSLKRLMSRHGTRMEEVSMLLRAERFIDLHTCIREGLKASVERYSLKDIELFTPFERKIDLRIASSSRRTLECALELNEVKTIPKETLQLVEDYNKDDCLATSALHEWLEFLRDELVSNHGDIPRPEIKTGEASEEAQMNDTRAQVLAKDLIKDFPENMLDLNSEQKAKLLLSNLLEYFKRETNSAWWEYFRLNELGIDDMMEERKVITGMEFFAVLPKKGKERNPTHRYKFPGQEVSIKVGDTVVEIMGEEIGTVMDISVENGIIDIKKAGKALDIHPYSIHQKEVVKPEPLASSLMDFAESVFWDGIDSQWPFPATKALLLRQAPKLKSGKLLTQGEDEVKGAIRIALDLDNSVLPIQGPPGSGKTYTGAMVILELAKQGKKVGVTAVSHKVIRNLFDAANSLGKQHGYKVAFVHKPKELSNKLPDGIEEVDSNPEAFQALERGKVVGGTAWLWSHRDVRGKLDYLIVDEAGQMSLAFVLAASMSAKNLILLGDPQQLEQPQKGAHPEGSDVAALNHLLNGAKTIHGDKGIFLGVTRRLHPEICEFTSEVFYEKRLTSMPGLDARVVNGDTAFAGAGLFYVPIRHKGNQSKSDEEVNAILKIVRNLEVKGQWIDGSGKLSPINSENILIVAPYNAQVVAIKNKLPDIKVGTVDKFQGQEAAVVIYSMTSSSPQDAPHGMNFLYNLNRLNVATSRAKSVCILVCSPTLLDPDCKTIEQMKLANALCRFIELAETVRLKTIELK